MRTAVFYFSGTGNTKKIAELYKTELERGDNSVDMFVLPLDEAVDIDGYDLVGVGYPVHGFNAPQVVLDFVKSLGKRKKNDIKTKAFVFKTSGEPVKMIRASSLRLISLMKSRGLDVKNEYGYVMPYNIIFRHTDSAAYKMWETAKKLVPLDCAEIISGTPRKEKRVFMGRFISWVVRIEHFGARFNGRFFKVKGECVGCGKCASSCPMKNIAMKDGKPKFGKSCAMCMRCSFYCPKNCIKIGLFDGWRVNGAYSFEPPAEGVVEPDKHKKYCKKAYDRYYREAGERIAAAEKTQISE